MCSGRGCNFHSQTRVSVTGLDVAGVQDSTVRWNFEYPSCWVKIQNLDRAFRGKAAQPWY